MRFVSINKKIDVEESIHLWALSRELSEYAMMMMIYKFIFNTFILKADFRGISSYNIIK